MKAPASKGPRHSLCQSWTAKGVNTGQNPRIHDSQKKSPNFTNCSVFLRIFLWQFGFIFWGTLGISTGTEANLNGYLKNIENTVHWKLSEVTEVFYHDPQGEISAKDSKLMSRMPSSPGSGAYTNTFFEKKRKALFF